MKRFIGATALFVTVSLLFCLTACTVGGQEGTTADSAAEPEYTVEKTIVDFYKNKITLTKTPQKILCIGKAAAEMVCDVGASVNIAATDSDAAKVSAIPITASEIDLSKDAFPQIRLLAPDIIFVNRDRELSPDNLFYQLEINGFTVIYLPRNLSLEQIEAGTRLVGTILDREDAAEAAIASMRSELAKIKSQAEKLPEKKRVYLELSYVLEDGAYSCVTCGAGSYLHEILPIAGGECICSLKEPEAVMSADAVIFEKPDMIFISPGTNAQSPAELRARKGWASVPAVAQNKVYEIAPFTMSAGGVIRALRDIAGFLAK